MIVIKIVLGIILVIILLVLILLCYILFAPIGYDLRGRWDGSRDVRFRIHDLLHIVSVKVAYRLKEGLFVSVKLIGLFSVMDMHPGDEEDSKESKAPEENSSGKGSGESKAAEGNPSGKGSGEGDAPEENPSGKVAVKREKPEENSSNTDAGDKKFVKPENPFEVNYRDVSADGYWDADASDFNESEADKTVSEEKASEDTVEKTSGPDKNDPSHDEASQDSKKKEAEPKEKKNGIFSYFTKENVNAVKFIIKNLLKTVKKLLPHVKKIDGTYSAGSPDITGQVFGVLSMMPALYKKGNSIIPDFESEKPYYDGELEAEGKIILGWFAGLVIKVLLHKDSRQLIFSLIKRE